MHTNPLSKDASLSALQDVHELIAENCLDCVELRAMRIVQGKNPVMRSDRRSALRALLLAMMPHLEMDEETHEIVLTCSIEQWGRDAEITKRTAYRAANDLADVGWIDTLTDTDVTGRGKPLRVVVRQELWKQLAVKRPLLNRLLRENQRRRDKDRSPERLVLAANLAKAKQRLADGNEPLRW